jgi:hypothetical protein
MRSKEWYKRLRGATPPPHWYRVEHRTAGEVKTLGLLADVAPHHATLAPFASRLVQNGASGELVLVDASTGTEVARQDVAAGPRRGPRPIPPEVLRGRGRGEHVVAHRLRSGRAQDRLPVAPTRPEGISDAGESWPLVDETDQQTTAGSSSSTSTSASSSVVVRPLW